MDDSWTTWGEEDVAIEIRQGYSTTRFNEIYNTGIQLCIVQKIPTIPATHATFSNRSAVSPIAASTPYAQLEFPFIRALLCF